MGNKVRVFSMFSGVGGFEVGIQNALGERAEFVGYSEIDKYAISILEYHFKDAKNYGDATNIIAEGLPDFDLLVAGFPCQPFSNAGKRRGFDDTRGTLFFDIKRVLEAKKPVHFLLENVRGLLSHDHGKTFEVIISELVRLGYQVQWQVLNSKNYGVPQNRERVFIAGRFGDGVGAMVFPMEARGRDGVAEKSTTQGGDSDYSAGRPLVRVADYRNDAGIRIRKECISPALTASRNSESVRDISMSPPLVWKINNNKQRSAHGTKLL